MGGWINTHDVVKPTYTWLWLSWVLTILNANLNDTNKIRYKILQDQLNDIIENEVRGSILRSLCKDYEEEENFSKYFFSLENIGANRKLLVELKLQMAPLLQIKNVF